MDGWTNQTPNPFRFGGAWGYITETSESGLLQLGARTYWPEIGRFIQQDPAKDGVNWYEYAENNPLVWVDPEGLGRDWFDDLTDFSAGMGDTLSFGLTAQVRGWMGTDSFVNRCSGWYSGGEWAGVGLDIAIGGAGGAARAGTKAAGREFSHFIPKRLGGLRSIWNGNYVTPLRHAMHDPYRYLKGMSKAEKFLPGIQQLDRIPWVFRGIGTGAGFGFGGRHVNDMYGN